MVVKMAVVFNFEFLKFLKFAVLIRVAVVLIVFTCFVDVLRADVPLSPVFNNNFADFSTATSRVVRVGVAPSFTVRPCCELFNMRSSSVLLWARVSGGVPFRPRRERSVVSSFVAFLLLTVELNPGPATLRFGSLNAGSAVRKAALIEDLIRDSRLDVLAISETWVRADAPDAVKLDVAPPNYSVVHSHRAAGKRRKGGGLALVYKNELSARPLKITGNSPASFELQLVGLQVGNIFVKVANIYRPPSSSKVVFLEEFADFLARHMPGIGERFLICGDFNMPGAAAPASCVDDRLSSVLDVHGYTQHVTEPTRGDNILDLFITPSHLSESLVNGVSVESSHHLSDHNLVISVLNLVRCKPAAVSYSYRNIRAIDTAEFEKRLRASSLFSDPAGTPDEYLGQLKMVVTDILDTMAPLRHGTRPGGRRTARWLDPEAVAAKRRRRGLERRWKRSGDEQDRVAYRASCSSANKLINESRNRHRYDRIIEAGTDAGRRWSAVKDLLYTSSSSSTDLASSESEEGFCATVATYFITKVRSIKTAIALSLAGGCDDPLSADRLHSGEPLFMFEPVTELEVRRLLKSISTKCSPSDFIPTSLVKACSDTFSPILARLANLSFEHESFPSDFKVAQVTPLLKKRGLDSASPSSYRPISNLNTISKIIERLVMTRMVPHVSASPCYDPVQSAYRKHHSTETALLKITDDIFYGLGARQSTVLVALDQSAAFDCVDHDTLICRLTRTFGISGKALGWIRSYLDSRSCFVRWKSHSPATSPLPS